MKSQPALAVIHFALAHLDSSSSEPIGRHVRGRRVDVNGVRVPVVRVPWQQTNPFFDRLYTLSNRRLFAGKLPACKLTWNRRFRSVAGRIDCRRREIELSYAHFETCGVVALGVVLIHEQIHLELFEHGLPYGHTPEFKRRSRALGLPAIHHDLPLPGRLNGPSRVHVYACRCGRQFRSRVKFRTPRACAECCGHHARGRFDRRFVLRYIGPELAPPMA